MGRYIVILLMLLTLGVFVVASVLFDAYYYTEEEKEQIEFGQEATLSQLLFVQNELADAKIFITYRFMVMDTLIRPEALITIASLSSNQLDVIAVLQRKYPNIAFGLRF
jgi:hypothetical protein